MVLASDRSPMTVVVPLPPSYRGGTEEYAYRLAHRFSQDRPVRVLTTTVRWKPEAPALDAGRASVERLGARELFERPLLVSPSVRRYLKERIAASSVLQLHMPFPLVEHAAVRAAARAGIPSVLTTWTPTWEGPARCRGRTRSPAPTGRSRPTRPSRSAT